MSKRVAVMAVIEREDGRLLFIRRAEGIAAAGYWTPVGGKVEPDEPLQQAVAREVFEEVGLRVVVRDEVFRCAAEGSDWELIWFACELTDKNQADSLVLLTGEVAEARWVTVAQALELSPMFADTRRFLTIAFNRTTVSESP
ncbi:MAG: NUDIX hydrolase [Polyangiaceae bacterium]